MTVARRCSQPRRCAPMASARSTVSTPASSPLLGDDPPPPGPRCERRALPPDDIELCWIGVVDSRRRFLRTGRDDGGGESLRPVLLPCSCCRRIWVESEVMNISIDEGSGRWYALERDHFTRHVCIGVVPFHAHQNKIARNPLK